MTWQSPRRAPVIIATLLAVAAMAASSQTAAASLFLPTGEPDPNCPELRLWLRADSGIHDAAGHAPGDPLFNGFVAAWHDRSPQKFDLGASPDQAPIFVERQPAAGNRPTVAFSGAQILTRTNAVLHDRPNSTVIFVVHGRGVFHSSGKGQSTRERLGLNYNGDALGSIGGLYMIPAGERECSLGLGLPGDGIAGGRFAVVLSSGEGDRRTLEFHDGMNNVMGGDAASFPGPLASDKCSRNFYLGGGETEFFCGQIAEAIVFNRGLSRTERRDMARYLRRRYELDMTEALFSNLLLFRGDEFEGTWRVEGGDRIAEGTSAGDALTKTVNVLHDGNYHIWLRGAGNRGLRTAVQGKDLEMTHVHGASNTSWQEAGMVELKAGPVEIVVRSEGPGNRFSAVFLSPTAETPDQVEDICSLAPRIRRLGSESHLTALFDNGIRLDGSLLMGWRWMGPPGQISRPDPVTMPPLICIQFDSRTERPVSSLESIIDLQNGDRLRGVVCGYVPATAQAGQGASARLLVRPVGGFFEKREQTIAVDTDWVRRIVFESPLRDRQCPPRTLICRNSRAFGFKAIRWGEQSVSLLTDDGVEQVALKDVAEVRMPAVDAWESYFHELSIINPEVQTGVIRVETSEGMTLTASARHLLQSAGPDTAQFRMMQPAWSPSPITVPRANIRLVWQAPAHVVPLSRFVPDQVTQRGTLGNSWKWQVNHNVAGGSLTSGGLDYLWGFGTHARCEMTFQLPDCVRALRSGVGIDSAVGSSGCAIAKVYVNQAAGTPLYESKRLVGSDMAVSTGEVALPAATPGAGRRLVLVTESAGDLRGEKGDPLDIGNHVDWLEPVLLLDPARLRTEVEKRRPVASP